MRIVLSYAAIAAGGAIVLAVLSFCLTGSGERASFWSNLLSNIVAELVGFSIGAIAAYKIATTLADKKLGDVAPHLVKLLRQLRTDSTLSGLATRCSMICAVALISETHFDSWRSARTGGPSTLECTVCGMESATAHKPDGRVECGHCGLPGELWKVGQS
jgi:hypothetical protein